MFADINNKSELLGLPINILVDVSNVLYDGVYYNMNNLERTGFQDWGCVFQDVRERVLNFKSNFKNANVIMCGDKKRDNQYWRSYFAPSYKLNRKHSLKIPKHIFDKIKNKLKEILSDIVPWSYVEYSGVEADDIIAVLTKLKGLNIIFSVDKDLKQLVKENVYYYNTKKRVFETNLNPKEIKFKLTVGGDSTDGIPNIFADEDTYLIPSKSARGKKSCGDKKQQELWLHFQKYGFDSFKENYLVDNILVERYNQNKTVVDLDKIPDKIVERIKQEYVHSVNNINKDVDLFTAFMSVGIQLSNRLKEF